MALLADYLVSSPYSQTMQGAGPTAQTASKLLAMGIGAWQMRKEEEAEKSKILAEFLAKEKDYERELEKEKRKNQKSADPFTELFGLERGLESQKENWYAKATTGKQIVGKNRLLLKLDLEELEKTPFKTGEINDMIKELKDALALKLTPEEKEIAWGNYKRIEKKMGVVTKAISNQMIPGYYTPPETKKLPSPPPDFNYSYQIPVKPPSLLETLTGYQIPLLENTLARTLEPQTLRPEPQMKSTIWGNARKYLISQGEPGNNAQIKKFLEKNPTFR